MPPKSDIIHVHIFEPHRPTIFGKNSKNDKAELHIYRCESKDQCDAFKGGTCINVGNVFGARCPIGTKSVSSGFSQRARKYYDTIKDWKSTYEDFYQALKPAPKRITKMSGGWMLPYSYIADNKKIPFESQGSLLRQGCPFLTDDDMTSENMAAVISFRPRALYGHVLTDYAEKTVPKFLHDFKTNYPDTFNDVLGENEEATAVLDGISYIGRTAYLTTIKPGVQVTLKRDSWLWDGSKISMRDKSFMIFEPCKWESCYAEFVPTDKATVEITDDDQVDENTVFSD